MGRFREQRHLLAKKVVFIEGVRGWEMTFWNESTGKIEKVTALESNYQTLLRNNAGRPV